jgi:hypothetical protein
MTDAAAIPLRPIRRGTGSPTPSPSQRDVDEVLDLVVRDERSPASTPLRGELVGAADGSSSSSW